MTDRHRTDPPPPVLGRILLYVRDMEAVANFYELHFGFRIHRTEGDRIVELEQPRRGPGATSCFTRQGRGRKGGQTLAKLVFDVAGCR